MRNSSDFRSLGDFGSLLAGLLFGQVVNDEIRLSEFGEIVNDEWLASADIRREIQLDEFVIMPNHLHSIVWIIADIVGATGQSPLPPRGPTPKSLGSFIAGYKSAVTKRINEIRSTPGNPVWQRNYYEHIVRNEQDLDAIRRYIKNNPAQWAKDLENPSHNSAFRENPRWMNKVRLYHVVRNWREERHVS